MAKRTGSGGRPPFGTPQGRHSKQLNLTIPLELNARLENFAKMMNVQSRGQCRKPWMSGSVNEATDS